MLQSENLQAVAFDALKVTWYSNKLKYFASHRNTKERKKNKAQ